MPLVRTSFKVLLTDAVLLVAGYFIILDLQERTAYATLEGLTPTYSYSLLTQTFTMAGRGLPLASPPTLDWVQVIVGLLLVVNVWYLYRILTRRAKGDPGDALHDAAGFS